MPNELGMRRIADLRHIEMQMLSPRKVKEIILGSLAHSEFMLVVPSAKNPVQLANCSRAVGLLLPPNFPHLYSQRIKIWNINLISESRHSFA